MIVCPRCEQENPTGARFCLNCGLPLSTAPPAPEERKVVTVLFCDLVGFTERSDHADPEDVKATLSLFHSTLKDVIEHHGGTIDKFIGDAVLGVFGAPLGHEDDPERAVRAAMRIQDAFAELNEADPELALAVRIGIDTGEVVVSFGAGPQIGESLTGDVVNTASRLQSVAGAGRIVVGEPTYQATRHQFIYEELEPVIVKGKSEALEIFRPIEPIGRSGVDPHDQGKTPFIGRGSEAATLRHVYRKMEALREQGVAGGVAPSSSPSPASRASARAG